MALVLLRLRLLIARRHRGRGTGARVYFFVSWVLGAVGGLVAGLAVASLVSARGYADLLVLTSFCAIFVPWVIGPIVEPTLADGTIDPQLLEQFPLTVWQQVRGLLLGALVSPTATFTFLFAAGALAAPEHAPAARVAVGVSAAAFTVLCVSVSRSAQALLAGALRSRRGSDLAAVAASLLVLGGYLFAQQAQSATEAFGGESASGPLGTVLGWTPPGAAGHAITSARDGDWLGFTLRLAVVVGTIGLALIAWAAALRGRVSGTTGSRRRSRVSTETGALRLTPRLLRSLPPGPAVGAASQQWRYYLRSPRAIQTLIIPPVMGVVVAHSSVADYGLATQVAAFASMTAVAGGFNLFGYDGPGFTYLILGGAPLRRVLLGKALAPLLHLLPLVVGFTLVEAQLRGAGSDALPAILAGTAVVVLGVGVGSLSSILNPSDQSRVGERHGSFLKVLAWFLGFFLLAGLGGVLWLILGRFNPPPTTGVLIVTVTALFSWALLGWAGRLLERDPYRVLWRLEHRPN